MFFHSFSTFFLTETKFFRVPTFQRALPRGLALTHPKSVGPKKWVIYFELHPHHGENTCHNFLMWIQKRIDLHIDRQTFYFTTATCFSHIKQYTFFNKNSNETRRNWAILAAPVVANSVKKTCGFLMWIQKCMDLHIDRQILYFTVAICFACIKQYTFSTTTRTKLAATERYWRLASSPIV